MHTIRHWRCKFAPETVGTANKRKYEEFAIIEVCKRLQQGESGPRLAKELGVCSKTVYDWRNKYSIQL